MSAGTIFLIGGSGFVGQAYARLFAARGLSYTSIGRDNYASLVGADCDILINANGNSRKFLAERDPVGEFDSSVTSVVRSLADFRARRYVFLSSGDVYPDPGSPATSREDAVIDPAAMSRYGLHKFVAETMVRSVHPAPLVIRMGGFVGPGMRKNAIFDMLNGQPLWLHPDSRLQFIRTDAAAALVWSLVERDVVGETVNLGATGTVRIGDIYDRVGATGGYVDDARRVTFEIATDRLARWIGGPLPESAAEVDAFLAGQGR